MSLYIPSTTALDTTENIAYRRGTVKGVDFETNLLNVLCGDDLYTAVPSFYQCEKTGEKTAKAFSIGDDVLVRMYNSTPHYVVGFYGSLWPCIPMPSLSFTTDDRVYSFPLFRSEGHVESDSTLFNDRYNSFTLKSCEVLLDRYINVTPPDDLSGRFCLIEVDSSTDIYSSRDTSVYYDGNFIYRTYNEETIEENMFNGTRSNIIGAFINPINGIAILVYQINTFSDFIAEVSGRVDFDFYIYSSCGRHEKIAGGYSIVTSEISTAYGDGIYSATGGYSEIEDNGKLLCIKSDIRNLSSLKGDNSTNAVSFGSKVRESYVSAYDNGIAISDHSIHFEKDSYGRTLMPNGSFEYTTSGYYKKDI